MEYLQSSKMMKLFSVSVLFVWTFALQCCCSVNVDMQTSYSSFSTDESHGLVQSPRRGARSTFSSGRDWLETIGNSRVHSGHHSDVTLWFVNLATRGPLTVRLKGSMNGLRYSGVSFGQDRRQHGVRLSHADTFIARGDASPGTRRGKTMKHLSDAYRESYMPEKGDCIVIISNMHTGSFSQLVITPILVKPAEELLYSKSGEASKTPARRLPQNTDDQRGSLIFYNTMETDLGMDTSFDLVLFEPSLCVDEKYCLFRILSNFGRYQGSSAKLRPGNYELKVVAHNQISNLDKFKNTPSLINKGKERTFVRVIANEHTYLFLGGRLSYDATPYPAFFKKLPGRGGETSFEYPQTELLFFNAYPSSQPVTFNLKDSQFKLGVKYKEVSHQTTTMFYDDVFDISLKPGGQGKELPTTYHAKVSSIVPYRKGICVFIAEPGRQEAKPLPIEGFVGCWNKPEMIVPENNSWIMSYHALYHYRGGVDILLSAVAAPGEPAFTSPRVYIISSNLRRGIAQPAAVAAGYYSVKVVPTRSINTVQEYSMVKSLVEDICVQIQPHKTYFGIANGLHQNPNMPPTYTMFSKDGKPAQAPNRICSSPDFPTPVPFPEDDTSSDTSSDTPTLGSNLSVKTSSRASSQLNCIPFAVFMCIVTLALAVST